MRQRNGNKQPLDQNKARKGIFSFASQFHFMKNVWLELIKEAKKIFYLFD